MGGEGVVVGGVGGTVSSQYPSDAVCSLCAEQSVADLG